MSQRLVTTSRLLLVLFALAISHTRCARADDDGWLEFEEQAPAVQNQFEVTPQQFEQWVFQHDGTAVAARKKLDLELTLTIEEISRSCELTDDQKQKLQVAGARDIRDYFSEYEKIRKKYLAVRQDQEKFNQIWQEISPLQMQLSAGLFNQESMFKKIVDRTLSESQDQQRHQAENQRRIFRYRALVELYVMTLEKSYPLSNQQREGLIELILAETRPPNVFGQSNQLYLQYQTSQIGSKEILKIVDGAIGKAIAQTFQQGRGFEHHLKAQGVVPFIEIVPIKGDPDQQGDDAQGRLIDQAIEALINNPRKDL